MTGPDQTYAFSAFLSHFIEDLGLSRSSTPVSPIAIFSKGSILTPIRKAARH